MCLHTAALRGRRRGEQQALSLPFPGSPELKPPGTRDKGFGGIWGQSLSPTCVPMRHIGGRWKASCGRTLEGQWMEAL